MQQPAPSPPSPASANFAELLSTLAAQQPENAATVKAWNESDLGDDVVTLSYERALRAHARYGLADNNDRPLTREAQTGAGISQDEAVSPAAAVDGSLNMQASEAARGANNADLRSASVTIRLSKGECARLHKHAAEAGVTVSAYLRSCTFEAEVLRAEVKAALAELKTAAFKNNPAQRARERRSFWRWAAFGWLARLGQRRGSASPSSTACWPV